MYPTYREVLLCGDIFNLIYGVLSLEGLSLFGGAKESRSVVDFSNIFLSTDLH